MPRPNIRQGVTVIELMVVIACIGVLVGLLLPAINMSRESARKTSCSNKLHQVGLSLLLFENANGFLPSGMALSEPRVQQTWLQQILPFIEKANLYEEILDAYQLTPYAIRHYDLRQRVIPEFGCPSQPGSMEKHVSRGHTIALTSYLGVAGTNHQALDGVLFGDSNMMFNQVHDGLSNTLMLGERPASSDKWLGWWYTGYGQDGQGSLEVFLGVNEFRKTGVTYLDECDDAKYQFRFRSTPEDVCDSLHFWSFHPGGAHFTMCDGAVRFVAYSDYSVLSKLATRSGADFIIDEF